MGASVTVARNAAFLSVATVAARGSMFVLAVVMARTLGVSDYGLYGFAFALALILSPAADLGLTPYLSREAARGVSRADSLLRTLFVAKIALTGFVFVLAAAATATFDPTDGRAVLVVVVLGAVLVDGISQFIFGYFQGRERMGVEARFTVLSSLARALGGVVLLVTFQALWAFLLWMLLVSVFQLVVAGRRLLLATRPRRVSRERIAWGSVLSMGLMAIFVMVYARADAVLLGWLVGEREVGWYTAAYTFVLALLIVPWMIALALQPVFARAYQHDTPLFHRSWDEGVRAVVLVSLPLALVTSLLATPILRRLFGEPFAIAGPVLAVLAWMTPLAALNVLVTGALRGAGAERLLMSISAAGAVFNVALNAVLIPLFAMRAAASVTVATEFLVLLSGAALAYQRRLVVLPRLPYVRTTVALAALAGIATVVSRVGVELAAVSAVGAYVAVLAATRVLRPQDLDALLGLLSVQRGGRAAGSEGGG